jgi:N-acetyl sugar amidotransferase
MDSSDPRIFFDENGVCDHCVVFKNDIQPKWQKLQNGKKELEQTVHQIKKRARGQSHDCILGLSGGVDSSYMLHYAVKELGLNPLVFHVDGGWNSELAVNNIEVLVDKLGLDLFTEVIDWDEMREFQLACFKSGTPYLDLPQDHAFIATLYKYANKHGIKTILNGSNLSTECVRNPLQYFYYGTDMLFINDILKHHADRPITKYPFSSVFSHKIYLRYIRGVKVFKPLDCIEYVKSDALKLLEREYKWKPYPQKHFESRFTRFFEGYWLPKRFGFDTRRVQYSSLILTSQMSREDALESLKLPALNGDLVRQETDYISRKLAISNEELEKYLNLPKKYYWNYRNQERIFEIGARVLKAIGIEKTIKR